MSINLKIILISLISFNVFAQNLAPIHTDLQQLKTFGVRAQYTDTAEVIAGSPYSSDTFIHAKIKTADTLLEADVRYNVVKNEIEFKSKGESYKLVNSEDFVIVYSVINKTLRYLKYEIDGNEEQGYLVEKTNNDKVNFYLKEVIKYIPLKEASNPYDSDKPAHYKKENDLYLIGVDGKIKEMPSKKKEFLKLFPNKEKEIESFLKSKKISFKDEKDLLLLINYIDTLS